MELPTFVSREPRWTWLWWPLITLVAGVLISWVLFQRQVAENRQVVHDRMVGELAQYAQHLDDHLSRFGIGLRGARGFIESQDASWVGHHGFRRFVLSQDLASTYEGARGFGFVRRVSPEELGGYLTLVRADGQPAYEVRERAPNPGERRLVQLMEPREYQGDEVGLDIASVPERRLTAQQALETGREAITPPLTTLNAAGQTQRLFTVMLPVYRAGLPHGNAQERETATVGWVYTLLVLEDILAGIPLSSGIWLRIDDRSPNGLSTVFFSNQAKARGIAWESHRVFREVPVFNRTWFLSADASPDYVASLGLTSPRWLAVQGVFSTLVLTLLHGGWILFNRRQRERLASQALLATITQTTTQAVVGEDAAGKVIIWNHAAESLFGTPAARALGRPFDDVLADHHMRLHESEGARLRLSAGQNAAPEAELRLQGVVVHHLAISRSPIVDQRGVTVGQAMLFLDVTQRKLLAEQVAAANRELEAKVQERTRELMAAHDALEVSKEFLERTGRAAGVAGWRSRFEDRSVFWTREMRELAEVGEDFVVDANVTRHFLAEEDNRRFDTAVREVIARGAGNFDLEMPMVTARGRHLWVRVVGELLIDEASGNQPVGMIGAVQDISERHRYEQQLEQAKQQAETANESKSQFLANMSHEIRTPLNALLGINDLMLSSALTQEQRQLMVKSKTAGRSLMAIVNNVLDLAKIESGQMQLAVGVVDVQALLEELRALFSSQAQAKGLSLDATAAPDVPRYIKGDRDRLREMLVNLIGNAIKFTHVGAVSVQVRVVAQQDMASRLQWHVQDTGIGLSQDQAQRLFQPFVQADATTTRRYGGTGLGLAIVKRLCELMGGAPGVHSTPGQGSDFWIDLPLQLPEPEDIERLQQGSHVLDLLVVSRVADWRQACCATLHGFGWQCQQADSGERLLALLRSGRQQGDSPPDVLIIDEVDDTGRHALVKAVRHELEGAETAVLITLAAQAPLPSDETEVVGVLRLPVDTSVLFNAVTDVLAQAGHSKGLAMAEQLSFGAGLCWLDGARILLVEDNEINMEIAQRLLREQGAQVHACVNGQDAVDWISDPAHEVDLVLMDVQMPVMDGLEATRRIRSEPRLQQLPVLALTAGALEEERRRAMDAGMFDFLTKPLEAEQLIRAIRRWIESYRGHALPVRSRANPAAGPSAPWPELPGIEAAAARARMGDDLGLLGQMLGLMLADLSATAAWDAPVSSAERLQAAARMHKLKGSSGMLGAVRLYEAARRAEQALRAESADIAQALAAVRTELEPLEASLRILRDREQTESTPGAGQPLSAADLARLKTLLSAHDFEAVELYSQWRGSLRQRLDSARFEQLDQSMQALRLRDALELLGSVASD